MIGQLKRRLMFVLMGCFTIVIGALVAFIAIVPSQEKKAQIRTALESFPTQTRPPQDDDGQILREDAPGHGPRDMAFDPYYTGSVRDFGGNVIVAELDEDLAMTSWSSNRDGYYDDETIQTLVSSLVDCSEFGRKGGCYFLKRRTPDGWTYTILDATASVLAERRTTLWAVVGGIAAWLALFACSMRLVDTMARPIQQAFDRQKRFVADAGHELRTPIAVIQANADVLENEQGPSRWLSFIKAQTHRMEGLVNDLMFLTTVKDRSSVGNEIDLSSLVEGESLPFEALAFERGMSLSMDVQNGVRVYGDAAQLEKLLSILLNNAVKYGNDGGRVSVSLCERRHSAVLRVYNTGVGIQDCDRERIFERFYRVDGSRSRNDGCKENRNGGAGGGCSCNASTAMSASVDGSDGGGASLGAASVGGTGTGGGYGLGLAMAKEIADNHHGRICVDGTYGEWIAFTFEMKCL